MQLRQAADPNRQKPRVRFGGLVHDVCVRQPEAIGEFALARRSISMMSVG